MSLKYEIKKSETLGRYLVAACDLKPGDKILVDSPFVIGPRADSALVCFNCHTRLFRFELCKYCALAPLCGGEGCAERNNLYHAGAECDLLATLKQDYGLKPLTMVPHVGALVALRALVKRDTDHAAWDEFMALETHLEERRGTEVWKECEDTVEFISSLNLLNDGVDSELIQSICAAIDVNSFEVRAPTEVLRAVYLRAALMAHDCRHNAHVAITHDHRLVCHASTHIKKGDAIYYNYTDALKGTAIRQKHLNVGKYFKCSCERCLDPTELQTYISSAKCKTCKTGFVSQTTQEKWTCHSCAKEYDDTDLGHKVQCCSDKLNVINKRDEKELEEYIRNVSILLAPSHYLLLDAKQCLAGVLRDTINREPHPTKKVMRRKIELCNEIMPILDKIVPGISRLKAITLYELHVTTVQLAKKLFDAREITGSAYLDELQIAEKHLKRALEMLFIEPGNSPEGDLCAKALEEYRSLKGTMNIVLDGIHAEGKAYISNIVEE